MRSSMQKDLEAGRRLELDAIGGAVSRHGAARGVATPATSELLDLVAARADPRALS
jgi:2-dehydropantoate 2-reductase